MTKTSKETADRGSPAIARAPGPSAALVLPDDDEGRLYRAFDGVTRRPAGLFLAGRFFLEVEEEAELEVRLADGPVRARIRVVEVVRGPEPGMVVALVADDATTARIDAAITTT